MPVLRRGLRELQTFHQRVLDNLRLASSAFISGDVTIART
jgi:Na+/phosphate symporter